MSDHLIRLFPTEHAAVLNHSLQNIEELSVSQVQMLIVGLMLGEHDTEHFPTPLNDQTVDEFAAGGELERFYQRIGSLFGRACRPIFAPSSSACETMLLPLAMSMAPACSNNL